METKLTREYAEKVAHEYNRVPLDTDLAYVNGYMKAIEETNAEELLGALIELERVTTGYSSYEERLLAKTRALKVIKKATL